MHERVIHGDALVGVDDEHLGEEVARHGGLETAVVCAVLREEHIREELLRGVACILGPVFHVVSDGGLELFHEVLGGRAELLDDLVPLVDVCGAGVKVTNIGIQEQDRDCLSPFNAEATFTQSYKDAKIFENHLDPVMLVFIG